MTHPDSAYRQISGSGLKRFWIRLVACKLLLFASAILILVAISELQKRGLLGNAGTYALIVASLFASIGVFGWNFWPRKACPQCGMKMRGRNIRPKNQKGTAMILCCDSCKLFIDLGVGGD